MDYLSSLNTEQKKAVLATEGPVLIVAGAGAGKTKTITHRILHLISTGVAPERILAITFTNKAAKEMRERVMDIIKDVPQGRTLGRVPFISTFHSMGVQIIKENAELLKLPRHFSIFDTSDSKKTLKEALIQIGVDPKEHLDKIRHIISNEKGRGVTHTEYGERGAFDFTSELTKKAWDKYEEALRKEHALDFDDLLLKTMHLLEKYPEVLEKYQTRFQYIHIDEYQDTNKVQNRIVDLIAFKHKNVCVVGDTDQCLAEGTKIKMADGCLKNIENIKKNEYLLSNYGSGDMRPAKIFNTKKRLFKGDLIRIETVNGNSIESTPEHVHFAGYRGLSKNHPHHQPQSHNSNRRNINVTLCANRRGKTPMHLISIFGNDEEGKNKLHALGLSVRSAKNNTKNWRFETANSDYGKTCLLATKIASVFPKTNFVFKARLGGDKINPRDSNSLPCLPASSIMPGMALFTENGYDTVLKTTRIPNSKIKVFDLDIEKTHNFIANGILTHNCIYSWRGAEIKNMLHFERSYPEVQTFFLEQNYRSTKNILSAANEIIEKNNFRIPKKLFTEKGDGDKIGKFEARNEIDEAHFIAMKSKELIGAGIHADEIAVLYRANFQSRVLEEAFLAYGVPYQMLGTKFFERKEIKDCLAFIKSSLNSENVSDLMRIINIPPRGLGKVTLQKIIQGKESELPDSTRVKINNFRSMLLDFKNILTTVKVSDALKYIIKKSGMEDSFKTGLEEDTERLQNIMELVTLATRYDELEAEDGIEKFLTDSSLVSDQDSLDGSKTGVKLMTVHSSKGLEFQYVFICGLENDLFPHKGMGKTKKTGEDSEEERRLFYVAVTRAGKKLFLTHAQTRTIFGSMQVNSPSEFIDDIPNKYTEAESYSGVRGKPIFSIEF